MGYVPPPLPPDDPPGWTGIYPEPTDTSFSHFPQRSDPSIVPVSYRGGGGIDLPWWVLWAGFWTMVSLVMAVMMLWHAAGMDAR